MPGERGAKGRKVSWMKGRREWANRWGKHQQVAHSAESPCAEAVSGLSSIRRWGSLGLPLPQTPRPLWITRMRKRGRAGNHGMSSAPMAARPGVTGAGEGASYLKQERLQSEKLQGGPWNNNTSGHENFQSSILAEGEESQGGALINKNYLKCDRTSAGNNITSPPPPAWSRNYRHNLIACGSLFSLPSFPHWR